MKLHECSLISVGLHSLAMALSSENAKILRCSDLIGYTVSCDRGRLIRLQIDNIKACRPAGSVLNTRVNDGIS